MERYSNIIKSNYEINHFYFLRENRENQIIKLRREKQPWYKNDVWKLDEGNALVEATWNHRVLHYKETLEWKTRIP